MKRTLLLLAVVLSTTMASAQISHEVFGMVLGSEEQKVFEAWNAEGVKYERSGEFRDMYHIKSKNEERKPTPTSIDVIFVNHKLFIARYTYPKDHFQTVCELLNMAYGRCLRADEAQMKVFYDDRTNQFININNYGDNTILTYGINLTPPQPNRGPFGRPGGFGHPNQGQPQMPRQFPPQNQSQQ